MASEMQLPAETSSVQAMASMPADMAILKLENDTIQALATARPRNHKSIKADLLAQIEAYPSFAEACIYAKPVGKDESGKQKIARGLSIRAAEALAEAYGYNRVRSDVIDIPGDDSRVKVEATFTDYQKGRIWQTSVIVSKYYKSRQGGVQRHPDDRFYGTVVKAEASRCIRECITRSIPPGLRAELMEIVERKLSGLLDDKAVAKIVSHFKKLGVTEQQLEEYIGRSQDAGWTEEDRLNLHGVAQAIKDGETTIADAFGDTKKPANGSKPKAGGVSIDDLDKPTAAAEGELFPKDGKTPAQQAAGMA